MKLRQNFTLNPLDSPSVRNDVASSTVSRLDDATDWSLLDEIEEEVQGSVAYRVRDLINRNEFLKELT